ncbi:hypothetical protein BZA05DRAFT_476489 [Tricharina praecox]|uniref:uncharacterized protein n=1 Tax=Tricharina praecox TaxID=43433 RepID=UPI00221FF668|nr:uncharacterized protein BZA05DRAFT_476489 [Tricharina praecox]KAI5845552.1 hypothetical protein BZA05DRAFT_476489 [Tricharina praecox]
MINVSASEEPQEEEEEEEQDEREEECEEENDEYSIEEEWVEIPVPAETECQDGHGAGLEDIVRRKGGSGERPTGRRRWGNCESTEIRTEFAAMGDDYGISPALY